MSEQKLNEDALHDHPFYGYEIYRAEQQAYIEKILSKYKNEQPNEELKKKIWDELQMQKHLGKVTIPFKLAVRLDPYGNFPPCIEVILDTKV